MCRPTRRGAGPFRGNPNRPLRPIDPLRERATPESVHTYLVQETNVDHQGRSPRVRPFHCTPVGLTFAIAPNVGDSGTLFLSVGSCVRARPRQKRKPKNRSIFLRTQPGFTSSPPTKRSSSLPEFNLAPSPPTGRSSSRQDPNLASNPPTGRSSSRQGLNLQPGFISAGGALVNAPGPQPGFIPADTALVVTSSRLRLNLASHLPTGRSASRQDLNLAPCTTAEHSSSRQAAGWSV